MTKFLTAVNRCKPSQAALETAIKYIELGVSEYHHKNAGLSFNTAPPLYVPKNAGNKTMPVQRTVVPRDQEHLINNLSIIAKDLTGHGTEPSIILNRAFHECTEWLDTYTGVPMFRHLREEALEMMHDPYYNFLPSRLKPDWDVINSGVIGMTQEPGGKIRFFANPNIFL
jgi:hypothetical protein